MKTQGTAGHGLYRHLWASRACSNQRRALIGSWVTPPTPGTIKIEQGGDENITINHGCGGRDCGGSGNSDGNSDGDSDGDSGGGGGSGGDGGGGGGRESNDDNDNDNDNGYNNNGRQQWWRLPVPVPINGAR